MSSVTGECLDIYKRTLHNLNSTSDEQLDIGATGRRLILFMLERARIFGCWHHHTDHTLFTESIGVRSRISTILVCNHLAMRGIIKLDVLSQAISTFTVTINHERINELCEEKSAIGVTSCNASVRYILHEYAHTPVLGLDDNHMIVLRALLNALDSGDQEVCSRISVTDLAMATGINQSRVRQVIKTLHLLDYIRAPDGSATPDHHAADYPVSIEIITLAGSQQTVHAMKQQQQQIRVN